MCWFLYPKHRSFFSVMKHWDSHRDCAVGMWDVQDTAWGTGFISQHWDWDGFLQASWDAVTVWWLPQWHLGGSSLGLGDPEGQSQNWLSTDGQYPNAQTPLGMSDTFLSHGVCSLLGFQCPGESLRSEVPHWRALSQLAELYSSRNCILCAGKSAWKLFLGAFKRFWTWACWNLPGTPVRGRVPSWRKGLIGMCAVPVPVWNPFVLEHSIQELPKPCRTVRRHLKAPNPTLKK